MLADMVHELYPEYQPMTQSKVTRRRLEIDCQIAFLQEGFRQRSSAPWPSKRKSKRDSFPIVIRRRILSLDE